MQKMSGVGLQFVIIVSLKQKGERGETNCDL